MKNMRWYLFGKGKVLIGTDISVWGNRKQCANRKNVDGSNFLPAKTDQNRESHDALKRI